MNQLPPDPSKGGSNSSGRLSDGSASSSDLSLHQENNNSPFDQYQAYIDPQRLSPASDPAYTQDFQNRKRLGRPRRGKEKQLAARPQQMVPDNQRALSSGISQVKINDNDHMQINPLQACQFQMPMLAPSAQIPQQIGLSNSDGALSASQSSIPIPSVHPILPVPGQQPNMIPPVMYQNGNLSINQLKVQVLVSIQSQLLSLDNEAVDLLLKIFEIPNQSPARQQKIDSFTTFISNFIYTVPQNLGENIFFLLKQFTNKANSPLYRQLVNPPVPFVFQQSADKKVIYKFAPINNKNIEVPLNSTISSEYAIIASIIPSNLQTSGHSLMINGQPFGPVNFGEQTDNVYYLISSISKPQDHKTPIIVRLNQKIYQSFCWIVFYYVTPSQISQIENITGIDRSVTGVRTKACKSSCIFSFLDVIKKIYSFGYSICPKCHQNICLTNLIPIRQYSPQSYLDQIATSLSYQNDSTVIEHYNYFTREIDVSNIINDDNDDQFFDVDAINEEEDFDPDKFIDDVENECSKAMKNFTLS